MRLAHTHELQIRGMILHLHPPSLLQVLFSMEDNLQLLTMAYQQEERTEEREGLQPSLSVEQLVRAITSNEVLELVTSKLTES